MSRQYDDLILELVQQIAELPVGSLYGTNAFEPLIALLFSDCLENESRKDGVLRKALVQNISRFGQKAVQPLLDYLFSTLPEIFIENERHINPHMAAIHYLGDIGDKSLLPQLFNLMEQEENYEISARIARTIIRLDKEAATGRLIEIVLWHPESAYRRSIAVTLAKVNDSDVVAALILALKDPVPDVAIAAAWALGEIKAQYALPFLIEASTDFRGSSLTSGSATIYSAMRNNTRRFGIVAMSAINAIQSYRTDETGELARNCCVRNLSIGTPDIRWLAAYKLGELKSEQSIAVLAEALNDKALVRQGLPATVSNSAQWALQNIGTPEAIAALDEWHQNNP